MNAQERFFAKVERTPECWVWRGALSDNGYGNFWLQGKQVKAHQAAFRLFKGEIPAKHDIDHLCCNRACVNPAHLDIVTRSENLRRGARKTMQTHCKRGHALSGDNCRLYTNRFGHQIRVCRECERMKA